MYDTTSYGSIPWREGIGPEGTGTVLEEQILVSPSSSKADIEAWQTFLGSQGYDLGHWCVDGDYGSKTQAATRAFQGDHNLTVSSQGHATAATTALASTLGFGSGLSLTSAQRTVACPPRSGRSGSSVAQSNGAGSTSTVPGPLGKVAETVMSPRGLFTIGALGLIGVGLMMYVDKPQQPAMGNTNYDPANWTW